MQKDREGQETDVRSPPYIGFGLGTIDHLMPLKSSTRVATLSYPVFNSPTATQEEISGHDIDERVPPSVRVGLDMIVQLYPS